MNVQIMPALEATLRLNNGTPYEISNPTQAFYNEHFGIVGFSKLTPGGVNDFLNVEAGSALVGFSFNSNVLVTDPTPPEWTLDFFDLQFSNGGRIIMDDFTGSMTFRTTGVSPEPSSALFGIMCVLFTRRSKR
ncbi:MAG TPA: hypothetical protein PLF31_00355 [Candidatus Paceibacterota bacterium]|nr:hypothetical protein [Candidatus Paceibacterota bacterium]